MNSFIFDGDPPAGYCLLYHKGDHFYPGTDILFTCQETANPVSLLQEYVQLLDSCHVPFLLSSYDMMGLCQPDLGSNISSLPSWIVSLVVIPVVPESPPFMLALASQKMSFRHLAASHHMPGRNTFVTTKQFALNSSLQLASFADSTYILSCSLLPIFYTTSILSHNIISSFYPITRPT